MPDPASEQCRRLAAALVETDLLLGVDAVPVADLRDGSPIETASPTPPTPAPSPTPPARSTASTPPKMTSDATTSVRPTSPPPTPTTRATLTSSLELAMRPEDVVGHDPAQRLAAIREHHATHCPLCRAGEDARSIVFGEGDPHADLVFVGEAPGEQEDREGRPFVGEAGELLDKMITALGLTRDQVYITNVVKTRPLENRTPRPDEAAVCGTWLANELLAIGPKAIVALGGTPAKHLLQTTTGITRLRGVWGACRVGEADLPVMPTFHPAFVLQQYTPEVRSAVWQDLQEARARAFD